MKIARPDFAPWALARLAAWTAEQAAVFSLGLAPEPFCKPGNPIPEGAFLRNVIFRVELFKAYSPQPLSPAQWLTWCRSNNDMFDDDLARAIESQRPAIEPVVRPIQRQRAHAENILAAIEAKGYNPVSLPENSPGLPGVKSDIREALPAMTESIFNKAWQGLLDDGRIKYAAGGVPR